MEEKRGFVLLQAKKCGMQRSMTNFILRTIFFLFSSADTEKGFSIEISGKLIAVSHSCNKIDQKNYLVEK